MAQKTVYPGAQGANFANPGAGFQPQPQQSQRTFFPGAGASAPRGASVVNNEHNTPIAGFLFSVSRTPMGEYWPLYIGSNTLGRGANNSVVLSEASVSENHATIVVQQMKKKGQNDGILVYIKDNGSGCGTLLNGDSLRIDPVPCNHGDIITVGPNYELYLILVDVDTLKLKPIEEFQAVGVQPQAKPQPQPQAQPQPQPNMTQQWGGPTVAPQGGMPQPMNAANPFQQKGKTRIYNPNQPNE